MIHKKPPNIRWTRSLHKIPTKAKIIKPNCSVKLLSEVVTAALNLIYKETENSINRHNTQIEFKK